MTLTATALVSMRAAASEDELRDTLFHINSAITAVCANIAIELDKVDCGKAYTNALREHLPPAIEAMADALRSVRGHLIMPDTETVQ